MVSFANQPPSNPLRSPKGDAADDLQLPLRLSPTPNPHEDLVSEVVEYSSNSLGLGDVSFARWMVYRVLRAPSLASAFEGATLIDLGSGHFCNGMAAFARSVGVRHYVAVDTEHIDASAPGYVPPEERPHRLDLLRPWRQLKELETADFKVTVVAGDMLLFLSKLPSAADQGGEGERICFTVNGIDRNIIREDEYHKLLALELGRVTSPSGIVFGDTSESLAFLRAYMGYDLPAGSEAPPYDRDRRRGITREYGIGTWEDLTRRPHLADEGIFKKVSLETLELPVAD